MMSGIKTELENSFDLNNSWKRRGFLNFLKFIDGQDSPDIVVADDIKFDIGDFLDVKFRANGDDYYGIRCLISGYVKEMRSCCRNAVLYDIREIHINGDVFGAIKECPREILEDFSQVIDYIGGYIRDHMPDEPQEEAE